MQSKTQPGIVDMRFRVVDVVDPDPDLSWVGRYTGRAEPNAIDRFADGAPNPREYRYFVPANPEYGRQALERMEAYEGGEWHMRGIRVECSFYVMCGGTGARQTLSSGGLWGVESDCGASYEAEIVAAELAELCAILDAIGIPYVRPNPAELETVNH